MQNKQSEFINTMVRAGAGAGKTYGLIQKIIELVKEYTTQNDQKLPRFVVTTFTRKATQEVRERLLLKALELRRDDPDFGNLFLNFLKSSGFLMVSTIHGVLNQFLKQYGYLIGLDPDYRVTPSSNKLLTQELHSLLVEEPETMEMVKKYGWRNVRIFLLDYHRSSLFNPNLERLPAHYFLSYWSNKIEKLKQISLDLTNYIKTILPQSKSETLLRFYNHLQEIERELGDQSDLWNQLESLKAIYKSVPRNLGPLKQWDEEYKEMRIQIMEILSEINEDSLTRKSNFETYEMDSVILQKMGKVFSRGWMKKKIETAEIEMEDLELLSLFLLRNYPEETKGFSNSWNYWFIDEYQDTSPIQVELLNSMIGDCPHYVVGDPQQSIYFFRGARSKVFYEKLNIFKQQSANIEEKKINRRSLTPTLHFINDLMDLVNKHQFTSMESLSDLNTKELQVGNFHLISEEKEDDHLEKIVEVLKKLIQQSVNPSQIAILCRENSELQKVFLKISEAGLPAQIYSKGRFLEDRQVKEALSLWRFLSNPYNDINLVELLRSNWFLVSDEMLIESVIEKEKKNLNDLWSQVKNLKCKPISILNQALVDLKDKSHVDVWIELIFNTKAIEECTALDLSGRKEANLWKLVTMINEAMRSGSLNFTDPLELSLQVETNIENEAQSIRDTHQIQLMTIHGAKGLEFEHILLPFINHKKKRDAPHFFTTDLEVQFWVHSVRDNPSQSLQAHFFARNVSNETETLLEEESERLFYVAITRAKKGLHFFCPNQIDSLSKTGWAHHLKDFLSKGPGVYTSNSGQYEFQINSHN